MKRLIIVAMAATILGCTGPTAPPAEPAPPATSEEVDALKVKMTTAFAALEIYSADNGLKYPTDLAKLQPKYLDEIPVDPVSRKAIVYTKTEDGFTLGASGDYSAQEAEKGFPKMNQDGFYVKKASEFPTEE